MNEKINIKINSKRRRELIKEAHKRNMHLEEYITLVLNRDYEEKINEQTVEEILRCRVKGIDIQ